MTNEAWVDKTLEQLRQKGLERRARCHHEYDRAQDPRSNIILNLSSNDYLNLARSPAVIAKAKHFLQLWGAGTGASRLITGTMPFHEELEERLASFKSYPAALVFGSGYMANAGTIPALVSRADYVIADKLAHASIIDASTLSRAKLLRFRHNDINHLADILRETSLRARRLIITESVFSMDGDLAPLKDIAALARNNGAMLMVDEAHSTGIYGPNGAGLIQKTGITEAANICMATLSKALGGYGGFVACSKTLRALLVNKARSFIYSTAMPPAVAGAAIGALDEIESHPELGAKLLNNAKTFRDKLQSAGLNTGNSASQIIPVIVGDNNKTIALSKRLQRNGILATAIRPPTVPQGTARLRLSITLAHSPADLNKAAETIIKCAKAEKIL